MPLDITRESRIPVRVVQPTTPAAALTALGIVYGDLGTSPLYTLQTVVQTVGVKFTPQAALGILSLILWALLITISAAMGARKTGSFDCFCSGGQGC
jgi:K+ transporter